MDDLAIALSKDKLIEYKQIALDYFLKNKIRICIEEFTKNQNGNSLFGIKIYKKNGDSFWLIHKNEDPNIFVWEEETKAAISLDNYFLPNLGYRIEQNKFYIFHKIMKNG